MPSTNPPDRRALGLAGLFGVAVSVALLWWTLHDVSPEAVLSHAASVDVPLLIFAVLLVTIPFPLRTVRWRILLAGEAGVSFRPLWHATAIGFMANNILPARAGEIARIFAAGKLVHVRYSAAFASIAIERVLDGLTIVILMTVSILLADFPDGVSVGGADPAGLARGAGIVFVLLLAAAAIAVHRPDYSRRLAARLLRPLSTGLAERALGMVDGLLAGLASLRDPRGLVRVAFWSFAIWISNSMGFLVAMHAFDMSPPWTSAFLLNAIIAFGVAIPSAPGFFGAFEAAIRVTLVGLYAMDEAHAVSYAVVFHLAGFIPITVLGLYSLSRAHLHLADLKTGT